jgi:hypothetical protein
MWPLLKLERRDRATLWLVDLFMVIASPLVALSASSLYGRIGWWGYALVVLMVVLRITRIDIGRGERPVARMRSFWLLVIPGRVREVPLTSIGTDYGEEGGEVVGTVTFEGGERRYESVDCFRAQRVADWLEEQRLRLTTGLPEARVVLEDRTPPAAR